MEGIAATEDVVNRRLHPRQIHVDAVVQNDGLTAIAATQYGPSARPLVARVIRTGGSVEAEMRAVILAMQLADKARWVNCTFMCDALGVVRMVNGEAVCRPKELRPLRDRARAILARNPNWGVEWVRRTYNSSAHAFAGQILRAYKHGREHGRSGTGPRFEKVSDWEASHADAHPGAHQWRAQGPHDVGRPLEVCENCDAARFADAPDKVFSRYQLDGMGVV